MPPYPVRLPIAYDGSSHKYHEIAPHAVGYLPPGMETSGHQPTGSGAIYISMADELIRDVAHGLADLRSFFLPQNPNMQDDVIKHIGLTLGGIASGAYGETWQLVIDSLSASLAARVIQLGGAKLMSGSARVSSAREYIHAHLGEEIRLEALAAAANTSQFHLIREFKKHTKLTPTQYIYRERVHRAKKLLQHSRLPLADIAFQCGFSSQSHMTTLFKKATGHTPAAFRASRQ